MRRRGGRTRSSPTTVQSRPRWRSCGSASRPASNGTTSRRANRPRMPSSIAATDASGTNLNDTLFLNTFRSPRRHHAMEGGLQPSPTTLGARRHAAGRVRHEIHAGKAGCRRPKTKLRTVSETGGDRGRHGALGRRKFRATKNPPSDCFSGLNLVAGAGSNLHLRPEQVKMVAGTGVDHNLRSTPVKMVAGGRTHHNLLFRAAA
jgi:hypothetical protein